jgi:hypothetical protein
MYILLPVVRYLLEKFQQTLNSYILAKQFAAAHPKTGYYSPLFNFQNYKGKIKRKIKIKSQILTPVRMPGSG